MGDTPQHPGYEEMKDTPWITQGREIADIGGKGVLENYNKVNVFDEPTQASLEARNNAIYKRAFDNMEKAYTDTMNKYNAKNYNQFGTLNSTPSSYITDNYQRNFQRQMDDLAYNQAVNYDTLMDNELNRRYNTLNMFNTMYGYGNTPYQQDLANWNIRNTNRDISYQNALANNNSGFNFSGALKGAMSGASTGSAFGPWGALAGGVAGGAMGGFM
jgi:hypothetical protein